MSLSYKLRRASKRLDKWEIKLCENFDNHSIRRGYQQIRLAFERLDDRMLEFNVCDQCGMEYCECGELDEPN